MNGGPQRTAAQVTHGWVSFSTEEAHRPMGLFDTTQIALEQAMQGAALRQQVLSNNVANANTPGFVRSDVDFHAQLADALEQGGEQAVENLSFAPTPDRSGATRVDGSNVDVDVEMTSMAQNALDYQTLAAVAKTRLRLLQIAIGGAAQ